MSTIARFRILFPLLLWASVPRAGVEAQAQGWSRFSFEPRVGAALPIGAFGDVDRNCPPGGTGCDFPLQIGADAGWRWASGLRFEANRRFSVSAGFGAASFRCQKTFCGLQAHPKAQGVSLGTRAVVLSLGTMDLWVEAGGVLERVAIVRTRDASGNENPESVWFPWSPGFTTGIGLDVPFTEDGAFMFSPGFRYQRVPVGPPDGHADLSSLDATYVVAEVGFRFLPGGR